MMLRSRLVMLKMRLAVAKALGFAALQPTLLSPEQASAFATKAEQEWQRIWKRAIKARPKHFSKVAEEPETFPGWARRTTQEADNEYAERWLLISLAAYLAATRIGKPTDSEQEILLEQAASAIAEPVRRHKENIAALIAAFERQPLSPIPLQPSMDTIPSFVSQLEQAGINYPPTANAKQILTQVIEESNAEAAKLIDPLVRYREIQTQMGSDLRYQIGQLTDGVIDRAEFRKRVQGLLDDTYREMYRTGSVRAGGRYALSESDMARVKALVTDETKFLSRWLRDMDGKYAALTPEQFAAKMKWRADLYVKALRGVFHEGWAAAQNQNSRAIWRLGFAEHCPDCLAEAAKGFRPLSSFTRWPGDGSTKCVTNCRCHIEMEGGSVSMDIEDGPVASEESDTEEHGENDE